MHNSKFIPLSPHGINEAAGDIRFKQDIKNLDPKFIGKERMNQLQKGDNTTKTPHYIQNATGSYNLDNNSYSKIKSHLKFPDPKLNANAYEGKLPPAGSVSNPEGCLNSFYR